MTFEEERAAIEEAENNPEPGYGAWHTAKQCWKSACARADAHAVVVQSQAANIQQMRESASHQRSLRMSFENRIANLVAHQRAIVDRIDTHLRGLLGEDLADELLNWKELDE